MREEKIFSCNTGEWAWGIGAITKDHYSSERPRSVGHEGKGLIQGERNGTRVRYGLQGCKEIWSIINILLCKLHRSSASRENDS